MTKTIEQMNEDVWKEMADKEEKMWLIIKPIPFNWVYITDNGRNLYCRDSNKVYYDNGKWEPNLSLHDHFKVGHPPHIWVVMQWINKTLNNQAWDAIWVDDYIEPYIKELLEQRPEDKLSEPLPTPGTTIGEEWRDVLLFLSELLWH